MKSQVEAQFSDFYEKWMSQLEDLLQLVLVVSRDHSQEAANYEAMINKLTAHHKDYYKSKWAAAHQDILAFFAPVWLTPLENAHLWVTGWKPSSAFRLVDSLRRIQPLTDEQVEKIEALKVKIKVEEDRVEREMERQQVAVADRRMVELASLERRAKRNGSSAEAAAEVNGLVEAAMQGLLGGLEKVMKMADCARLKTLKGILDILTPMQGLSFLASKTLLQMQIRKLGEKEKQRKNVL